MKQRRLPPLAALRAFEAAARHLSFRKAAAELAVTPTAISHQIRILETDLGLTLFDRHIRRVSLTAAGRALFPPLRDGFAGFARAIDGLYPQVRRVAVTLTATPLFTERLLIPSLGIFRARYPDFEIRLHASEAAVDLQGDVADAAVRYGTGPFPGLVAHPLGDERFGVLCSPTLGLVVPADLRRVTLLHAEWHRQTERTPDWRRWAREAGADWLDVAAGPRFTDESHAIQAAIAGQGAVIASPLLLRDALASGVLVQPFGPLLQGDGYHFVATPGNMACADVVALRRWIQEDCLGHVAASASSGEKAHRQTGGGSAISLLPDSR
ncbi:MAG TPA: LysR substrate-binding domain-containing protein [Aliidongia sp.]|uniref:LysR substrate-binding domain-containing protein n=1 Tax=Aliidongia sp. TaxID=1914230 RepID=UPI002DDD9A72|nr:LysR substrate-binding domain-containing protein [Aliidongia sp.]HEV2672939.1 LysR substrate-binding domain-containing protein [Aliidongia sp.]